MEEIWEKMYEEAKKVLKERQISKYVLAGSVSAAILSGSGKIYTGIPAPNFSFGRRQKSNFL